jgi:hypothetical protein
VVVVEAEVHNPLQVLVEVVALELSFLNTLTQKQLQLVLG